MGYQNMANRARTLLTKHQLQEDLLYWPEYPDQSWVIPPVESVNTRDEIGGRSLVVWQQKVEQCLVQLDNIGWWEISCLIVKIKIKGFDAIYAIGRVMVLNFVLNIIY